MTEPFLQTLFPGQARICGRVLPPLTFWRLQCLLAVGSPFLGVGAETRFTLGDLLHALRVVRTGNLSAPDLRPRLRDVVTQILHRHSRRYLEKQGGLFLQYLALHQIRPELWQNQDGETRSLTAPVILSQVVGLMECGLSHAEAWDTAPGYGAWIMAAVGERKSDRVKIANEDDDEHVRIHEELVQRSEAEIVEEARQNLPPQIFDSWLAARQENHIPMGGHT